MSAFTTRSIIAPYQVDIEQYINNMCFDEDKGTIVAIRFLLHSIIIGTNASRISKVAGINHKLSAEFGRRARSNKIWVHRNDYRNGRYYRLDKVACDWFDPENGHLYLMCDARAIMGFLSRNVESRKQCTS